jgi:amidase
MTSREQVEIALDKIQKIDKSGYTLNSVLALRDAALAEADSYDKSGKALPLGGQPILIKDNIEAVGLPATAGSLALADTPVDSDSPLVTRLKEAGAIVIGATNLSEWANIRSTKSTSGWSGVGGLTANPWIHKHSAGGSSSGSGAAVGAGLVAMAVGSETDGSIICPASLNGCVGIKPTVGSVPREQMIPISASQDSPGPMTQTVAQAALLLEVMTGQSGFVSALTEQDGIRIGVVKNWMTSNEGTNALFHGAVDALAKVGISITEIDIADPKDQVGDDEYDVLKHELVSDLGTYLKGRKGARVTSLAQVVAFNLQNRESEMKYFKQEIFDEALQIGGRGPKYQMKRDRNLNWATMTLGKALANVDVLIGCSYSPAWVSKLGEGDSFNGSSWITTAPSIAGAPIGAVPMGLVDGLPVGMGVVAARNNEVALVRAMAAIEKAMGLGVLTPTFTKDF